MKSHNWTHQLVAGGVTKTITQQQSAASLVSVEESVPDSSTDLQIALALDVSACKSFLMVSTVDMLIETNSGSAPDDTINLVADKPYIWTVDSYDAFQFTTDITALFATQSTGDDGVLTIEALFDPTP